MPDDSIRLQKFIADTGIASRRQAEAMIEEGRLTINGIPAKLGSKVVPGKDRVHLDGGVIHASKHVPVVLALNKPKGLLCSNRDPHHSKTVFDLVPPSLNAGRLFCSGRLDKESEGLLILTNDGALSQKLTHPSHRVIKRYRVTIDRPLNPRHIKNLLEGITWEGERLKVEKVIPEKSHDSTKLEVHLQHGKKREIRRLFIALGYGVTRLIRFQIGKLTIRGIGPGKVKQLTNAEIELLFS